MPGLGRSLCAVALLPCLSWRDSRAGLLPGELHSSHNTRTPRPRTSRSSIICVVTTSRVAWLTAVMSPNPTVAKTVTVKYSASVRVSGWVLKLAGFAFAW